MIRSFFAIELPEAFYLEFERLQAALKPCGADVKWVRPASVHLTVKFLGNVSEDAIEPLAGAVGEAVAGRRIDSLRLAGLGCFPNIKRPRVVWVGLEGDIEALQTLQTDVEAAAEPFGFKPENREFKPHLTLGRVKSGKGKNALISEMERLVPKTLEFHPREVVLFRSDLNPRGAIYTVLKKLPLAG